MREAPPARRDWKAKRQAAQDSEDDDDDLGVVSAAGARAGAPLAANRPKTIRETQARYTTRVTSDGTLTNQPDFEERRAEMQRAMMMKALGGGSTQDDIAKSRDDIKAFPPPPSVFSDLSHSKNALKAAQLRAQAKDRAQRDLVFGRRAPPAANAGLFATVRTKLAQMGFGRFATIFLILCALNGRRVLSFIVAGTGGGSDAAVATPNTTPQPSVAATVPASADGDL